MYTYIFFSHTRLLNWMLLLCVGFSYFFHFCFSINSFLLCNNFIISSTDLLWRVCVYSFFALIFNSFSSFCLSNVKTEQLLFFSVLLFVRIFFILEFDFPPLASLSLVSVFTMSVYMFLVWICSISVYCTWTTFYNSFFFSSFFLSLSPSQNWKKTLTFLSIDKLCIQVSILFVQSPLSFVQNKIEQCCLHL